jgi:uncharacterized phage protein (predicted DNA packaging)
MFLEVIKSALRVSHSKLNSDIIDLIEAAKMDLVISGISSEKVQLSVDVELMDNVDPLIKRAITIYCKSHFESDNEKADRFQKSYDMLKSHLSLAVDYQAVNTSE